MACSTTGRLSLRERTKRRIGRWLVVFLPRRAARIAGATFLYDPTGRESRLDRLLRVGLAVNCVRRADYETLARYHANFWRGPLARQHHERARGRFEAEFLPKSQGVLGALECRLAATPEIRTLCEIGTGHALVLNYLATRFARLDRLIGIDLSAEQVIRNREDFRDPRLEFVAGDACDWILKHGPARTVYFAFGGVLEYFTPGRVEWLLTHVARVLRPAVVTLVEPVAEDHDLRVEFASRPHGRECSFSHNYLHLAAKAGLEVFYVDEVRMMSARMLALCAAAP